MWRVHFLNLLGRSWRALMSATSSSTLGFFLWTILVAVIAYFAGVLAAALKLRSKGTVHPFKQALTESLLTGIFSFLGLALLVLLAWAVFVVPTVYSEHQMFVAQNATLTADNATLRKDLNWRKHNISTTDAVFPNLIYMLQAFVFFKRDMNGTSCILYFSAPKETAPLASVMAQLAGPLSGCSPLGPVSADDPDLDQEVIDGMVTDAIVVHAAKGEKAADKLFTTLGNQIQLKRSYRLLRNPKERSSSPVQNQQHLVWLQFGKNVKWNSELR